LFLTIFCLTALHPESKPDVAILPLTSIGVNQMELKTVTELLESSVINANVFIVIGQKDFSKVLSAQEYSTIDFADQSSAVNIGRLLSVEQIITGSLLLVGNVYILNVEITDVETAPSSRWK
jgi:hypothetical protein